MGYQSEASKKREAKEKRAALSLAQEEAAAEGITSRGGEGALGAGRRLQWRAPFGVVIEFDISCDGLRFRRGDWRAEVHLATGVADRRVFLGVVSGTNEAATVRECIYASRNLGKLVGARLDRLLYELEQNEQQEKRLRASLAGLDALIIEPIAAGSIGYVLQRLARED